MDGSLELGQFATLTGGAAMVIALVEVIKRTLNWDDATTNRFAPLASLAVGIAIMILITIGTGGDILQMGVQALFAGIVTGLYACGLYSIGGKPMITAVAGPANGKH